MTGKKLPTCWSWPGEGGSHMIAEGAVLESGEACGPHMRTLCGRQLRIDVPRVNYSTKVCDTCTNRLRDLIAAAMAG